MKCINQGCLKEFPFGAMYCPFCGTLIVHPNFYSNYKNSLRQFTKSQAIDGKFAETQWSIPLHQTPSLQPGQLPELSGYGSRLIVPDSINDVFRVYNILESMREEGTSSNILSGIKDATTPVFDGIFMNSIKNNLLYRFGTLRQEPTIVSTEHNIPVPSDNNKIATPLVIRNHKGRFMFLLAGRDLCVINLNKEQTVTSRTYPLPALSQGDIWHPLIHREGDNSLFLFSQMGHLYQTILNHDIEGSPINWQLIRKFEVNESLKPVFLGSVLVTIGVNPDTDKLMFCSYDSSKNSVIQKQINDVYAQNVDLFSIPIHTKNRIIVIEKSNRKKLLRFDISGSYTDLIINENINSGKFLMIEDRLFTLNQQMISVIDFAHPNNSNQIYLTHAINQSVRALTNLFYLEGFFCVQTADNIIVTL